MSAPVTILFTCCGGAGGWAILRSLEGLGRYRLIGVDSNSFSAGLYDKGLAASYVVPNGDEEDYIPAILDIAKKEGVSVVWPTSDEEVIAIAQNREAFAAAGVKALVAAPHIVERCVDKLAMVRLAENHDIPTPLSWRLDEDCDYAGPVIVRPRTARGGKGVIFFEAPGEWRGFRDGLGDAAKDWFVQEKLVSQMGDMHLYATVLDGDDTRLTHFMSRSVRTAFDWGGPSLGGVPVKNERLQALGESIIAESGPWYGPVNAEFLYDRDKQDFIFIEVNPRYWGYSYLATAAGVNFPDIAVRMALGERVSPNMDFRTDVVTLTSREQLAVDMTDFMGSCPAPGYEDT